MLAWLLLLCFLDLIESCLYANARPHRYPQILRRRRLDAAHVRLEHDLVQVLAERFCRGDDGGRAHDGEGRGALGQGITKDLIQESRLFAFSSNKLTICLIKNRVPK